LITARYASVTAKILRAQEQALLTQMQPRVLLEIWRGDFQPKEWTINFRLLNCGSGPLLKPSLKCTWKEPTSRSKPEEVTTTFDVPAYVLWPREEITGQRSFRTSEFYRGRDGFAEAAVRLRLSYEDSGRNVYLIVSEYDLNTGITPWILIHRSEAVWMARAEERLDLDGNFEYSRDPEFEHGWVRLHG
jgi:hypothetical protein